MLGCLYMKSKKVENSVINKYTNVKILHISVPTDWDVNYDFSTSTIEDNARILKYGIDLKNNEFNIINNFNNTLIENDIKKLQDERSKLNERIQELVNQIHNKDEEYKKELFDYKLQIQKSTEQVYELRINNLNGRITELISELCVYRDEYSNYKDETKKEFLEYKARLDDTYKNINEMKENRIKELENKNSELDLFIKNSIQTKNDKVSPQEKGKLNEKDDESILREIFEPRNAEVINSSNDKYSADFQIRLDDDTFILFDSKSHSGLKKITNVEVSKLKDNVDLLNADGGIICASNQEFVANNGKKREHFSIEITSKGNIIIFLDKMRERETYNDIIHASLIIQSWKEYDKKDIGSFLGFLDTCRMKYRSIEWHLKSLKNCLSVASESLNKAMEESKAFKTLLDSNIPIKNIKINNFVNNHSESNNENDSNNHIKEDNNIDISENCIENNNDTIIEHIYIPNQVNDSSDTISNISIDINKKKKSTSRKPRKKKDDSV